MRPRERELNSPPAESSASPSTPPPRPAGGLSSMVVRLSDADGGDLDPGELSSRCGSSTAASDHRRRELPLPDVHHRRRDRSPLQFRRRGPSPAGGFQRRGSSPAASDRRRRELPLPDVHHRRRDRSPLQFRRRGPSPAGGFQRRGSPPPLRRRGRRSPPPSFQFPRSYRFHDSPGYRHAGSVSPSSSYPRLDNNRCSSDFDHQAGPSFARGFQCGRVGRRFRDISPQDRLLSGERSVGRRYDAHRRGVSPSDGEYIHRNDPNLSPREGDWICANPRCGNLNFARRSYCNNCDEPRFATAELICSPRRGYFTSPPLHESPSVTGVPLVDRCTRRNFGVYRSPPRGWGNADDPRDSGAVSSAPRRGVRFHDDMRRARLGYEDAYHRGNWHANDEWRRNGFIPARGGDEQRHSSPLPHDQWVCERRSPMGSHMGRGQDDHRYGIPRGRAGMSEVGRGRGLQHPDDSFVGQNRTGELSLAQGRDNGDVY